MKGMGDMLRQAQQMQRKMLEMQQELATRQVEATAGGGMVTVKATGAQEILSVTIDKAVVDPADVEMLQDLVLAAVNDALKKARDLQQNEMAGLTGGLNIPGLF